MLAKGKKTVTFSHVAAACSFRRAVLSRALSGRCLFFIQLLVVCYTDGSFQVPDDKFLLMTCLLFLQGRIPAKFYVLSIIHMLVKEVAMTDFLMLSLLFFSFFNEMLLLRKIYRITS